VTTHVTYAAILRALEVRAVPLGGRGGPPFAYAGADGEIRGQAWAVCPACGHYGLRVDRRDNGAARVACRASCRPQEILAALAAAVAEKAAA
jgi:hypothetical protein